MTDAQNSWVLGVAGSIAAAIAWLFKRWFGVTMATLATKDEMKEMEARIIDNDDRRDAEMEERIRDETLRLHNENQSMFHEIRDDVKLLLRTKR